MAAILYRNKVKLSRKGVISNIETEEELLDMSILESLYNIRKLKALTESMEYGSIKIDRRNKTQVFSKKYDIWFEENEFTIL